MRILKTSADLNSFRGAGGTVALVPTMGALHEGHLSLVKLARQQAERVVVSIFVNPTQFGPGEDFERYPRTLDADLEALGQAGADAVFVPEVEVMYPGEASVQIDPGPTAQILEGAIRPGHFAGVCQVVAKLFNLVRPDVAVFGEKDAQQLAILRQMTRDLSYPIRIIGAPIIRDIDGLALSSRNAYLSSGEREAALALHRSLEMETMEAYRFLQETPGVEPQYVALVTNPAFELLAVADQGGFTQNPAPATGSVIRLVAARVGATRLIDNRVMELPHV